MTSLAVLLAVALLAVSLFSMRRRRLAGLAPSWPLRAAFTTSLVILGAFVALILLMLITGDSL
jgi:hypothetical protein